MEENYIVITDNNNNNYGILKVCSKYSLSAISHILKGHILDMFENEENFFRDFSSNLSKVLEVFDSEVGKQGITAYTSFYYNNTDFLNIDNVGFKEKI